MTSQALSDIMALVDDLAGARDEMNKACAASLILLRVCALTGDDARAEMEKRRAPCAPLKVPSHQRALKGTRAETLDEVVEHVAEKLELVPVRIWGVAPGPDAVTAQEVDEEIPGKCAARCRGCRGECSSAEDLCEGCGRADVPWVNAS